MLFLKNLNNTVEKAGDYVSLDKIDKFYTYFFSLHTTSFIVGENSPAMYGWRKIAYEAPPLRFSRNYLDLLRLIIRIAFLSNISTNP